MYAAVRHYASATGLVDALVAHEADIRRLLQDIEGFRAYYIIDTGGGSATSVSVYEDRAGAEASTAAARGWIAANLPDMAASPPQVGEGQVALAF